MDGIVFGGIFYYVPTIFAKSYETSKNRPKYNVLALPSVTSTQPYSVAEKARPHVPRDSSELTEIEMSEEREEQRKT